jgi:two-component system, response regulator PdtaR
MSNPENKASLFSLSRDEHLIKMDIVSSLEADGLMVFEAENAAEAIRCLELHREIILIFTDVNMPGSMDGLALAHYVHGRWPPVKIIVTSGYAKVRDDDLPRGAIFVEKPYPKNLADKMNELMAA